MKFVYAKPDEAAHEITATVNESLEFGSVLLLVSGGSNIELAVRVRENLRLENNLTIGLIDERYGEPGHPDSNWTQLLEAGLITKDIRLLPVITNESSIHEASNHYAARLQEAIASHDTVIGIYGIGTDGHTAGILPGSPAVTSHEIVTFFNGPDYPRITTTPSLMPLLNHAFLVSYNEKKYDQLRKLQDEVAVTKQPAQALKQISNLIVFTDLEGIIHSEK